MFSLNLSKGTTSLNPLRRFKLLKKLNYSVLTFLVLSVTTYGLPMDGPSKISDALESAPDYMPPAALRISEAPLPEAPPQSGSLIREPAPVEEQQPNEGWAIKINGSALLYTLSKETAENVLNRVKTHYVSEENKFADAEIIESVEIEQTPLDSQDVIYNEDVAVNYILTGSKEPLVYTVVKGDSPWKISRDNNIPLDELISANPGIESGKIQIGQLINLYEVHPYVTVRSTEIASTYEPIAFSTNYENNDDMYKGQQKVVTKGVPGSTETQTMITKENGAVVDSVLVASAIVTEPQSQLIAVGTKAIATFTGTGSLMSPLDRIEISSGYGSRGRRGHTGADMRAPTGTPVHAADDGVVTFAQYKSSYGNFIILNHGKGLETCYAHCSAINVSVGQVVNKGDTIGAVGTTGNATGAHLHFEVRLNGVFQNPLNYF